MIFEEAEPIVPMVGRVAKPEAPMSGHTLRDRVRPVAGGLQINFPGFLCTLGFSARARGIPGTYFTTNSHCTAERGTVTGTSYWQPLSSVANSFIGTEIDDPPFLTGGIFCPQGWRCRFSDAAGARLRVGRQRAVRRHLPHPLARYYHAGLAGDRSRHTALPHRR